MAEAVGTAELAPPVLVDLAAPEVTGGAAGSHVVIDLREGAEPGPGTAGESLATRALTVSALPLVVLIAVAAVDQGDRALLSAVFPLIKEQFHLSDTALGTLSSAYTVVGFVGVIPAGILVDRYVRKRIVAWGAAIWSFFMVLVGMAQSFGALFGARMFLGVAEASYGPASFSLISDYYPVERRGRMLGIYGAGSIAGFILLPVGGILATAFGWHAAFEFYAFLGFPVAILAWRLKEPERGSQDMSSQNLGAGEVGSDSAFARLPTRKAYAAVLRIPTVLTTILTGTLSIFFLTGLGLWLVTFMVRYHHMSIAQATSIQAIFGVAGAAGSFLGGHIGDALVRRGIRNGRIYVAATALVCSAAVLFLAFSVSNTALFVVGFALGTPGLTIPNAPLSATRADVLHPDLRGRAASAASLLSVLAGAFAPLIFGVASDAIGLKGAFLLSIPLMALGGILLGLVCPRFLAGDMDRMARQLAGQEIPAALGGEVR